MNRNALIKGMFIAGAFGLMSANLFAQFDNTHVVKTKFTKANATDQLMTLLAYDVNKDGKMDLLLDGGMGNTQSSDHVENSNVIILNGDGAGGFTFNHYIPKGTLHFISDIKDYDKDGYGDLIMYDFFASGIYIYKGGPGSIFTQGPLISTSTHGFEARYADYDNDGDLDIINIAAGSTAPVTLHVLENTPTGFVKHSFPTTSQLFCSYFTTGDINGDGLMDVLAVETEAPHNHIFIQQPDHSFIQQTVNNYSQDFSNASCYYRSLNDVNGDGKADFVFMANYLVGDTAGLVHGEYKMNACFSSGTGQYYDYQVDDSTNNFGNSVEPAYFEGPGMNLFYGMGYSSDFDKDGALDYVFATQSNGAPDPDSSFLYVIYDPFNIKNHKHVEKLYFANVNNRVLADRGILIADFNGDCNDDIAVITTDDTLRVFLNQKANSCNPTGIGKVSGSHASIKCYPNPAKDQLYFEYQSENNTASNIDIVMTNATGSVIKTWKETKSKWSISTREFARGMYFIKMNDGKGMNRTEKVVLQ